MKVKAMSSDTVRHGIPPQSPWFFYVSGVQLRYTEQTFYVPIRRTSPKKQINYFGQKITSIWNGRQGVRIQRDVQFHHSHPCSFTCPEYSSDTRDRHCTAPSENTMKLLRSTDNMKFKAMNSDTVRHGIPPQSPCDTRDRHVTSPSDGRTCERCADDLI